MTEPTSAPRTKRPPPKLDLSDVEWKLGLGAALASAFTAAWFAVAQPQPAASSPDPVAVAAPPAATVAASPTPTPRVSPVSPVVRPTSAVTTVAVARPRRAARVRTRSS
jgi:hypothetical protein